MITLLKTKNCVWCQPARKFFEEYGLAYEEIDVAEHPEWIPKIQEAFGKLKVPVLVVDGEFKHMGFDLETYKKILLINAN